MSSSIRSWGDGFQHAYDELLTRRSADFQKFINLNPGDIIKKLLEQELESFYPKPGSPPYADPITDPMEVIRKAQQDIARARAPRVRDDFYFIPHWSIPSDKFVILSAPTRADGEKLLVWVHEWFDTERMEYRPPFYTRCMLGVQEAERDRRRANRGLR